MVAINFDATKVDPNTGGGDVFETGEYTFQIVSSSVKATKKGDGTMLILEASCMDEGMAGKRLTIRLNVQNPNPQAVEIAYRDLSAICYVTGQLQIQDSQQLHGRPFRIRLEKLPRSDDPAKFNNEIRAYMDVNGNPPGAATGAAGAPPAPPSAPPAPPPAAPAAPQAAPPAAPPATPAAPPAAQPWQQPQGAAPAAAPAGTPPWQQPAAGGQAPAAGAVPPWQQG